jgi:hypothetical protein
MEDVPDNVVLGYEIAIEDLELVTFLPASVEDVAEILDRREAAAPFLETRFDRVVRPPRALDGESPGLALLDPGIIGRVPVPALVVEVDDFAGLFEVETSGD